MTRQRSCLVLALLALAPTVDAQGVSAIYDANGLLVGEFAEYQGGRVSVHSVRGFRFSLDGDTGAIIDFPVDVSGADYGPSRMNFTTPDCSGQAFASAGRQYPAGGVILPNGLRGLYYVAKAPVVTTQTLVSFYTGTTCEVFAIPPPTSVVPAFPNDPNVTGVPNLPFVPPIRLEMTPISSFFGIFKDGFESTQSAVSLEQIAAIA